MKDAYPELIETAGRIAEMVKGEETRFAAHAGYGKARLTRALKRLLEGD